MKRIGFFVCLLLVLVAPALAISKPQTSSFESGQLTELPWTTVDAVLKRVALQGNYTYGFLVAGYNGGTVTVEQSGSSYLVTIYGMDGASDTVIIEHM